MTTKPTPKTISSPPQNHRRKPRYSFKAGECTDKLTIALPPQMRSDLAEEAAYRGLSLSSYARHLLTVGISKERSE